jgi:hypothetical protein
MNRPLRSLLFFGLLAASLPVFAQEGPLENTPPQGVTPEEIITHFAAKEKLFKEARDHYTYRQDIKVQTRDGDTVTGEYHEVFDVLYDDKGHRIENVVFAPQSTLEQGNLRSTKAMFRISAIDCPSCSPPMRFRNTTFSM